MARSHRVEKPCIDAAIATNPNASHARARARSLSGRASGVITEAERAASGHQVSRHVRHPSPQLQGEDCQEVLVRMAACHTMLRESVRESERARARASEQDARACVRKYVCM
jgi:hypothetical protein